MRKVGWLPGRIARGARQGLCIVKDCARRIGHLSVNLLGDSDHGGKTQNVLQLKTRGKNMSTSFKVASDLILAGFFVFWFPCAAESLALGQQAP